MGKKQPGQAPHSFTLMFSYWDKVWGTHRALDLGVPFRGEILSLKCLHTPEEAAGQAHVAAAPKQPERLSPDLKTIAN